MDLHSGIRWLRIVRLRGFISSTQLARAKKISPIYINKCACCKRTNQKEDLDHLMVKCNLWKRERKRLLAHIISLAMIASENHQDSPNSEVNNEPRPDHGSIVDLLLGGESSSGNLLREAWLKPHSLTQQKQPQREVKELYYQRIAEFFQKVMPVRTLMLNQLK